MVHRGFQQLYRQESTEGCESPKAAVRRLIAEHKDTLEGITVVGHSLGGGKSNNAEGLVLFCRCGLGYALSEPVIVVAGFGPFLKTCPYVPITYSVKMAIFADVLLFADTTSSFNR